MADKTPWLAAEQGTYSGGSTLVTLSGSAVDLGGYPSRTFAQASVDADTDFEVGDTAQVTVSEGADTWGLFAGVVFASETVLDFGAATKMAGEGALTNGGSVYVFAGQPPGPVGDMLASVYDPQGISGDAFARSNQTGTQLLSTISDAGTAAASDAVDFDAAGTAAAGDAAHLSAFDHSNIPSADQADALDNNSTLNAGNPVAGMGDLPEVISKDRDSSGATAGNYAWNVGSNPGGFILIPTGNLTFDNPTNPPALTNGAYIDFLLTITFGADTYEWGALWKNTPIPPPSGQNLIAGVYDGANYVLGAPVAVA